LLRFLNRATGRLVHIRFHRVEFEEYSLELSCDWALAQGCDGLGFDMAIATGPAIHQPALAIARRHAGGGDRRHVIPVDVEDYLWSRQFLLRSQTLVAKVPVHFEWSKLLAHLLVSQADNIQFAPLLPAVSHRFPRRLIEDWTTTAHVVGLYEETFGNLLAGHSQGHLDRGTFARLILAGRLAAFLPAANAGHFHRQGLKRAQEQWEVGVAACDIHGFAEVACRTADILGIRVTDNADVPLEDSLAELCQALAEETALTSDPGMAETLRRMLDLEVLVPAAASVDRTAFAAQDGRAARRSRTLREQLMSWRAECARQIELQRTERLRARAIKIRNAELRQELAKLRSTLDVQGAKTE
jgi:hypothetical protein